MKLIPLLVVLSTVYFCGSMRDKLHPPTQPTPVPIATVEELVNSGNNNARHQHPVPSTISGGQLNEKATSLPQPIYPAAARAVRASGSVSVQVTVDENGNVLSATAVSGHPLLRRAAVDAAKKAIFEPRTISGKPVKVTGVLTYDFPPA